MLLLKYVSKCVRLIARFAIIYSVCLQSLIFHLEIPLTLRNLISSHDTMRKVTIFGEKMKSENLALLEKHVFWYKD